MRQTIIPGSFLPAPAVLDVFEPLQKPRLPAAPRNLNELLGQLAGYDAAAGLDAFLDRFDFTSSGTEGYYRTDSGACSDGGNVSEGASPAITPRRHLREVLLSAEFRNNLILDLCRAVPEKKRLLFVHVPKCAGTDLISHLSDQFPHLSRVHEAFRSTYPDILDVLKGLALTLARRSKLAVSGHITLSWMMDRELVRPGDEVFTLVRDPIDLLISHANFMASTLMNEQTMQNPDIRRWMLGLGVGRPAGVASAEDLRRLALAYLHHPGLLPRNTLCTYLGHGTVDSALALSAAAGIEISTVTRYDPWLQLRWGICSKTRLNASLKILSRANLPRNSLDDLYDQTQEDRQLYARIEARLAQTGHPSLLGSELA